MNNFDNIVDDIIDNPLSRAHHLESIFKMALHDDFPKIEELTDGSGHKSYSLTNRTSAYKNLKISIKGDKVHLYNSSNLEMALVFDRKITLEELSEISFEELLDVFEVGLNVDGFLLSFIDNNAELNIKLLEVEKLHEKIKIWVIFQVIEERLNQNKYF